MSTVLHLLDIGVLMALINGRELGTHIDEAYKLRASTVKPLVCRVTHGELWALAKVNGYGVAKRNAIAEMLASVVVVDISDPAVIDAYVDVYVALRGHPKGARTNVGENDMWIAAAARATEATLLTLDSDFVPLIPEVIAGALHPEEQSPRPWTELTAGT